MTSLIFGTIYLAHQGIVHARHEKKRIKNYERWEGLRDEYDEQRKIGRETRSLDIQRTGQPFEDDRPILTLRDQQEAGDARTGWRPQESWNGPDVYAQPTGRQSMDASAFDYDHRAAITGSQPRNSSQPNLARSASLSNSYNPRNNPPPALAPQPTGYHGIGPMRPTATGANWDDGLPRRLSVQKRTFDETPLPPPPTSSSSGLGRSSSSRTAGSSGGDNYNNNRSRSNLGSANSSANHLPLSNSTTHTSPLQTNSTLAINTHTNTNKEDGAANININNPFAAGNRFDSYSGSNSNGNSNSTGNLAQVSSSPAMQQSAFTTTETSLYGNPPRHDSLSQVTSSPARQQQQSQQSPAELGSSGLNSLNVNNPFESGNRFDSPVKMSPTTQPQGGFGYQQQQQQQQLKPQMTSNNPFEANNRWDVQQQQYQHQYQSNGATQAFAQQVNGHNNGRMPTLVEGRTPGVGGERDMSEWWK